MITTDFYVLVSQGIKIYQTFNVKEVMHIMQRENKEFEEYLLELPDDVAPVDNRIYCYREINGEATHELFMCTSCDEIVELEIDEESVEYVTRLCWSCYDELRHGRTYE